MKPSRSSSSGPSQVPPKAPRSANILFITLVAVLFLTLTVVFVFFPRTEYSELEKRELAAFPDISGILEAPAKYTARVSHWFSDSEPFRDDFMTMSMTVRDAFRYKGIPGVTAGDSADEELVTFRPSSAPAEAPQGPGVGLGADPEGDGAPEKFINESDGTAKIANSGIIIVGKEPNVRALMAYGGTGGGNLYASALNEYAKAMPGVRIYAMPVPTATEFYLPAKAKSSSKSQQATISNIHRLLDSNVKFVDAYTALSQHTDEDIYLRTDHHWAPLGAYYAARQFAHVAGVPFRDLSSYERKVIHGYVGSMYGYSKDISVKHSPEDFVYYVPSGLDYKAQSRIITTNKNYQATGESAPRAAKYFHHYKDGSGNAYLSVYGTDAQLMKVVTGTPSSRRLLVIKDSYGNQVPSFLFFSFGEVHVVDFRYFVHNIKKYVRDNAITDIVVCMNIFNVYGSAAPQKIRKFLTQGDSGNFAPADEHKPDSARTKKNEAKSHPAAEKSAPKAPEAAPEIPAPASSPEPSSEPAADSEG